MTKNTFDQELEIMHKYDTKREKLFNRITNAMYASLFFGVVSLGAGIFGGDHFNPYTHNEVVSNYFNSQKEIRKSPEFKAYQDWNNKLSKYGIIGFAGFLGLDLSLYLANRAIRRRYEKEELEEIAALEKPDFSEDNHTYH